MDCRRDFARIYDEHSRDVFLAASRVLGDAALAEDVAQEVFLALWRGCGYDPSRGPIGPFLRLLARSRAMDLWRRNRTGEQIMARLKEERTRLGSPAEEPSHAVLRAADRDIALRAVRSLPPEQRRAIGLTYWGDLTVQQAAELESVPFGTEKSRVRLGLRKLARNPDLATA